MTALLMLLLACGGGVRKYDTGLFHLASGYNAKEVCSCLFVIGQDEATCAAIVRVSPAVARFQVDHAQKTVRSRSLGGWSRTARFIDARSGCRLD